MFLYFFTGWRYVSYAQNQEEEIVKLPSFSPLSPEAAGLGRYGDVPVGLYTGVPDISIPLHTVNFGELQVPIVLSYHATGIKVEQEASWVGLGWNLQAGGAISMTVVGALDRFLVSPTWERWERLFKYPGVQPTSYVMMGEQGLNMFNECIFGDSASFTSREVLNALKRYGNYEPDIYHVNFLNYSFKFILHPNTQQPIFLGSKNKCKIQHTSDNNWLITGEDGVKYFFNDKVNCEQQFGPGLVPNYFSTWNLTRIEHPTGKYVNFIYKGFGGINQLPPYSHTFSYNYPDADPDKQVMLSGTSMLNAYLSEIETDNERVVFHEGPREDLSGDGSRKLDSLVVYDKISGRIIKKYVFSYEYFVGTEVGGDYIEEYVRFFPLSADYYNTTFPEVVRQKRLKLLSVKEIGLSREGVEDASKNPYLFRYNKEPLPYKTSAAKDHWGFYNGQQNVSDVPDVKDFVTFDPSLADAVPDELFLRNGANRRPSSQYMNAGMLEEIIYPTTGKTKFQFEPHAYANFKYLSVSENPFIDRMVRVSDYNDPSNQPSNVVKEDTFSLKKKTPLTLYVGFNGNGGGTNMPLDYGYMIGAYVILQQKVNGVYIDMSNYQYHFQARVSQESYNLSHNASIKEVFSLLPGEYRLRAHLPDGAGVQDPYGGTYVTGSVKYQELNTESVSPESIGGGLRVNRISNYDYDNKLLSSTYYHYTLKDSTSSGVLMSPLNYLRNKTIKKGVQTVNCYVQLTDYDTWVLTANSSIPLATTANGNYVGYSQVEVVQEGEESNGKEISYFVNKESRVYYHLPPWDNESNGNLIKKEVWNTKNIVRSYEYTYKTLKAEHHLLNVQLEDLYVGGDACCTDNVQRNSISNPYAYNGRGRLYYYPTISTWNVLESKVEKHFSEGSDSLNLLEFYDYNPSNYAISQVVSLDSDGKKSLRVTSYPVDYARGTTFIDNLLASNIITVPVEQVNLLEDKSGHRIVTNGVLTMYKDNGIGLKDEVYILESALPVSLTEFKFSHRLKGQLPIESESDSSFSPDLSYSSRLKFNKYDDRGNIVSLSQTDDMPITYLWGYNKTLPVAEIKNATYEQVKVALGLSSAYIDLGTGGLTDSQQSYLRDKLSWAMITSFIHDPLVGMTSMTDSNGRTTYYKYDSFGRLSVVRDNHNNILKGYEYNYRK
ncbi:RHS repeat domain-containing protein [Pontibacter silvestris]|uniref:RHS repeat domain-containing protein n=1 Tax=Pontibacter silvestris TaxID=2305183 RepID=A0ABW4WW72_9BACT|nr:RHS repeat domain-containing protein [Pontibacter silvestris]MCC9138773.1 RHS repeat protein [Pontibacter silvestris]